jgi:hypothetical protein
MNMHAALQVLAGRHVWDWFGHLEQQELYLSLCFPTLLVSCNSNFSPNWQELHLGRFLRHCNRRRADSRREAPLP